LADRYESSPDRESPIRFGDGARTPLSHEAIFTKALIEKAFTHLSDHLQSINRKAVIGLCGGTVMTLVHEARISTEDIDVWFDDPSVVQTASAVVGSTLNLPNNWFNDAVCDCLLQGSHPWNAWKEYSHLTVLVAKPDVLLVMKLNASRHKDLGDIKFLLHHLGLVSDLPKAWNLYKTYFGRDLDRDKKILITDALRPDPCT
jgi:hypothetical protein